MPTLEIRSGASDGDPHIADGLRELEYLANNPELFMAIGDLAVFERSSR